MTSSHRPTYHTALSGLNQGGNVFTIKSEHVCARDKTVTRQLKRRRANNDEIGPPVFLTLQDFGEDFVKFAEDDADNIPQARSRGRFADSDTESIDENVKSEERRSPSDDRDEGAGGGGKQNDEGDSSSSEEEDDDSSEDEDELLRRELEVIKRERDKEQAALEAKQKEEQMASWMARDGDAFEIKPSWEEEAVFRGPDKEIKKEKQTFVNDVIRSEFHKRFLHKYIL